MRNKSTVQTVSLFGDYDISDEKAAIIFKVQQREVNEHLEMAMIIDSYAVNIY